MSDNTISPLDGKYQAYAPTYAPDASKVKDAKPVEEAAEGSDSSGASDESSLGEEAKSLKNDKGSNALNEDPMENLINLWKTNLDKQVKKAQQPDIPKPQLTQNQSTGGRCAAGSG